MLCQSLGLHGRELLDSDTTVRASDDKITDDYLLSIWKCVYPSICLRKPNWKLNIFLLLLKKFVYNEGTSDR